jgi:phosphohistidine swiveling domain-containing protein
MFQFGLDSGKWLQIERVSIASLLGAQILFDKYSNFSWHLNGLRFRNRLVYFRAGSVHTFVPTEDYNFIIDSLKPRFLALDKELLSGLKKILAPSYKKLTALAKQVRRAKLSEMDDEALSALFLDYYQTTLNEIFQVNFKPLEIAAVEALTELVNQSSEDSVKARRNIATLLTMDRPSASSKEEIDLCQIAVMTLEPIKIRRSLSRSKDEARLVQRNYPDLYELFEAHMRKHRFVTAGYGEIPWSMEDFIRRYQNILELGPEWAQERIEELSTHGREIGKAKRKVFSEVGDDGTLKQLSKILSDLTGLSEVNRAAYGQALEIRELLTVEIVERDGVPERELRHYTLAEMLDLVGNRRALESKEIERRVRGVVLYSGMFLHSGTEANRFLKKHVEIRPKRTVLSGICAHPGMYEGSVRIVTDMADAAKVKLGEVVVTHTSGYELAEAFRKAGAILVESAGQLSSAAMMARETGTPCLVNVESATRSLSTGDSIIVDSENQTVCFSSQPGNKGASGGDVCTVKVVDFQPEETYIARLEEIQPDQANVFGEKAANIGALLREGFQVPDGFALGRSAMYRFLESAGCEVNNGTLQPSMVEKARTALETTTSTEFLQALPLEATVIFGEEGCAVRGSWLPGAIQGKTHRPTTSTLAIRTLEGLWKAIRKCWRAYLEQPIAMVDKGSSNEAPAVGGGVVIQQYKPGDRSGFVYSREPGTNEVNLISLEAYLGVGHSRSAKTRPDRYRISRKTERIVNRIIPIKTRFEMVHPKTGKTILIPVPSDLVEAEVLTRLQVRTLVTALLKIEKILDGPAQIDWTVKGGENFFLDAKLLK